MLSTSYTSNFVRSFLDVGVAVLIVCLDLHFFSRVGGPAHIFLAPRVPLLDWCMAVQPTGAGSWVRYHYFALATYIDTLSQPLLPACCRFFQCVGRLSGNA